MQDPPPPAVGNVLRENPLFGDADDNALRNLLAPPQLPTNVHMACNETTLRDYALPSLDMALGSTTTWAELVGKFLQKFFLISKAVQLRREDVMEGKFYEVWERFNTLIQKCPHHGFPEWISGLDRAATGALMNRTYEDAYEIIENMELNSCPLPIGRFTYGQKSATVKVIQ
ncbi:Retrotransposon gag protein [Gossypium australe]|uniref:Retrotransposon gag protein n=1 Tax=Gossypium australe TaxID=47621 RepID=A0A5B6WPD2_9ROSI|nr:Retrotransposon gag protein [Gossypium australe]